jgi:F1F0 ATPase subunit 2
MTKMSELIQETTSFIIIWCIGLGLGCLFFGGLWWTVRKSILSARPALWLLSSLLIRMGLTLSGFYFVLTRDLGGEPWQRLMLCLLGFLIARLLVTQFTRVALKAKIISSANANRESQHEPQP